MASFSEAPRAAKASPKPIRSWRPALRVFWSKVSAIASNSVCCWKQPSLELFGSLAVELRLFDRQRACV